jgi:hypothetical protein
MTDRRTRRILGALVAVGLSAAGLFGLAPEAKAAGILPSKITVSATANPAPADTYVVLTSDVSVLVKGLHLGPVTPTGTVTFSAVNFDNETNVEEVTPITTVPVSSCIILLSKCVATSAPVKLDSYAGEDGYMTLRATYNGDLLTAPSSASVDWSVANTNACPRNTGCDVQVYSGDGTASARVIVGSPGGPDATPSNLTAYFDTIPLSCTTAGTGDGLVVDVSGGDAKTIIFTTYGPEATKANANPDRICYSAPYSFPGSSFNDGTGQWEGVLPLCIPDGPSPCVVPGSEYTPPQTPPCDCDPRARLVTTIFAPPGDPKSTR